MVIPHPDRKRAHQISHDKLEIGLLISSLLFRDRFYLPKNGGGSGARQYPRFQLLDRDWRRHSCLLRRIAKIRPATEKDKATAALPLSLRRNRLGLGLLAHRRVAGATLGERPCPGGHRA